MNDYSEIKINRDGRRPIEYRIEADDGLYTLVPKWDTWRDPIIVESATRPVVATIPGATRSYDADSVNEELLTEIVEWATSGELGYHPAISTRDGVIGTIDRTSGTSPTGACVHVAEVLHDDSDDSYWLIPRWGSVGEPPERVEADDEFHALEIARKTYA